MAIKEISGRLFQSDRVIRCIAVNCSGNMIGDFAEAIKERYPEAVNPYKEMCRVIGKNALGEVQFIACHDGTIIANMFVQEVGTGNRAVVDTGSLEECLDRICIFTAKTKLTTGFPENLGIDRKYVDWEAIKPLISAYLVTSSCNCQIIKTPPKQQQEGQTAGTEALEEAPCKTPEAVDGTTPEETQAAKTIETSSTAKKCNKAEKRRVVVIHIETAEPDSKEWTAILSAKAGSKQMRGTAGANPPAITAAVATLSAIKIPCNVVLYTSDTALIRTIQQGAGDGDEALGSDSTQSYVWRKLRQLMGIHNVVAHHSSEIPAEKIE